MNYKKCPRCQLNYITTDKTFCAICLADMQGANSFCDEVSFDICPFCEKNFLQTGEEMCHSCAIRKQKRAQKEE